MAIDRIKEPSKERHRGEYFSCWLSSEQNSKLEMLASAAGLNKSAYVRTMLDGKRPADVSFWKLYRQLASIGGLIKYLFGNGKRNDAWELSEKLVSYARKLERQEYLEAERQGMELLKRRKRDNPEDSPC